MKYIKLFENYTSDKIDIPDDLFEWCYRLVNLAQGDNPYDVDKIPQEVFIQSKEYVNQKTNGSIWRGFGLWDELSIENENLNPDNTRTFKYDWGASWSYSKDVAIEFAEYREDEDQYGYVAEVDINTLQYPMCIDVVFDNLSEYQKEKYRAELNIIKKQHEHEKEVLVFDEFDVPKEDIEFITKP
jgi:hypothetical protein